MYLKTKWGIICLFSMALFLNAVICMAGTPGRDEIKPPSKQELTERSFKSAPGYCPQYGGSTHYESISSASLEKLTDGKTMRLVANVYIANPNGCKAGEACPSYDSSPEYVNAWIDFNGDQVFSADEKVMTAALSGYANINYSGTMTSVRQFAKPANHVESTYMRVNVGYNHNPTDPCESSWTYGNSVDYPVNLGPSDEQPQFDSVKILPDPPIAGENVKFEADIPNADKFEDLEIHWGFFDNSGTGNPFEYSTSKGLEGHGKKVGHVYLTYTDSAGDPVELHYEFDYRLFFRRDADDDNDGIPNWYEYWIANEAVSQLADTEYDAGKPCNARVEEPDGSVYYTSSYGAYSPGSDSVALGMCSARSRASKTYQFGSFYGTDGIDTCRQVVVHEFTHQAIDHNWRAGGAWVGKANSDFVAMGPADARDYNDKLPDEYENAWVSDPNLTDTWDLATDKGKGYKYYGDNEAVCIVTADAHKGVAERDWAYPGKQAPEKKAAAYSLSQASEASLPGMSGRTGALKTIHKDKIFKSDTYGFGAITSSVQDTNGDGRYEYLKVNVAVTNVVTEGAYSLVGWLTDLQGNEVAWASNIGYLVSSGNTIDLYFNGADIAASGLDGPYILSRLELRGTEAFDALLFTTADNVHTTQSYQAADFNSNSVLLNGNYSAQLVDTDGDGFTDHLRVSVGLTVDVGGTYKISGWMYDGQTPLTNAAAQKAFSTGPASVQLDFAASMLLKSGGFGPWTLTDVQVRNDADQQVALGMSVWQTPVYSANELPLSAILTNHSDTTQDVDGDGRADELNVTLTFNFHGNENRTISANLTDGQGQLIDTASAVVKPSGGSAAAVLAFEGKKIFSHRADGPYGVSNLSVFKQGTGVELTKQFVYSTAAYPYAGFTSPLIYVDDAITYTVKDLNGDTMDDLVISMNAYVQNNGNANAQASLYDINGNLIDQLEQFADGLVAGQANSIQFTIDGQKIHADSFGSPFKLTNLNVYHTGDPLQNWFIADTGLSIFYEGGQGSTPGGLTQTEVSQLYVSIFNRASEGGGNAFWQVLPDMATAATQMLETDAAKNYFGASLNSDQAFIEHIYLNTLNKTLADDPNGIAYWVGLLSQGYTRGQVVAELVGVIGNYAPTGPSYNPDDAATIKAYNQFTNRVIISNYMADKVESPPSGWETKTQFTQTGLNVNNDPTTVILAKKTVDVL